MCIPSPLSCHPGSSGGILQRPSHDSVEGRAVVTSIRASCPDNLLPFPSQALTEHLLDFTKGDLTPLLLSSKSVLLLLFINLLPRN